MNDCSCSLFEQPPCSACEPPLPPTPFPLINRPGLGRLSYRIGTFSAFRQAMLDRLVLSPVRSASPDNPNQVRQLSTRASDDYGVATIEMWAYVLDVLTFYQQAIANESFIRTAVLRESLSRLAALLGYEPARGSAATALIALLADKGISSTLPAGLRLQSVPAPGKLPVTFELTDKVAIHWLANQPVLVGTPHPALFVSQGELSAESGGPPVVSGTKLVFLDTVSSPPKAQEQVVSSVSPAPLGGKIVQWPGTLGGVAVSSVQAARLGRKFRFFGANAPASFPKIDVTDPFFPSWSIETTDFSVTANSTGGQVVDLDGTFDGISAGGSVWVYYKGTNSATDPDFAAAYQIASVAQGSSSRGPLAGACTVLTLDNGFPHTMADLRGLTIYEILGAPLNFRQQVFDDTLPAGAGDVYVADGTGIHKHADMILVSDAGFDIVKAAAEPVPDTAGAPYKISITPKLTRSHAASRTRLYANVVSSTQGETQTEQVLGDGDASQIWQEFAVPRSPVTYVPDATSDRGAASTLRVFVDDFQWTEAGTFYGRGPDEAIFTTRVDDKGVMHVRFGDGKTGRRLPTGAQNVTAQMRKGLGSDGNVPDGAISIILQQRPGLKAVLNPLAAFGGADPEPPDSIRETAPSTVITLKRAVSLRDYEVLALSYAGVAKARAVWADFQSRRGVALTVAAEAGKPLQQLSDPLRHFLDEHRDPNVPLAVSDYAKVHFILRATLHLRDGYKQSTVKAAAIAALGPDDEGYLSFDQLRFGQTIFQSALFAVLQNVTGVEWVELREFFESPSAAGHGFAGAGALREAIIISPKEIAWPTLNDSDAASVDLAFSGGVNDLEAP